MAILVGAFAVVANGATAERGILRGVVTRGPITPVCRAGVPCDGPAAHVVLRFLRHGTAVARVETSSTGSYRLRLRAGVYQVRTKAAGIGGGIQPQTVRVVAGAVRKVDFSIDTGIR
jgi:hypothetical protein